MTQKNTFKNPEQPPKTAEIVPGPNRFCLNPIHRGINTRWAFGIRFYDESGSSHEELHSADTRVEIETKFTSVMIRIRQKKIVLCDCGCDFTTRSPEG